MITLIYYQNRLNSVVNKLATPRQVVLFYISRRDIVLTVVSYFILFIPLYCILFLKGLNITGDAYFYLEYADDLIKRLANGQSLLSIIEHYNLFYFVSISLLAILKYLSGPHWPDIILIANAAFYSLCAPAVFLIYRKCNGSSTVLAALGAAILPLGFPEVLILGNIPLRDVPFTGAAALAICAVIYLSFDKITSLRCLIIFFLCSTLIFIRPNSIIITSGIVLAIIWMWHPNILFKKPNSWQPVFIILLLAIGIIAISAYWFYDPFRLPLTLLNNLLNQVRVINISGAIIIDHADMYIDTPQSYYDHLRLILLKFINYFHYWNPSQSTWHLAYRHVYFGMLFANTAYYILSFLLTNSCSNNSNLKNLVFFTFCLAISGAALHSILVLAFEFRYQMIIFPPIWSLCMLHIDSLLTRKNHG